MQKWTVLLILLVIFSSFTQEEYIAWSETNRLTWDDFKGQPDYSTDAAAITASGISYSLSALLKNDELEVDCKVVSYFFPQNSWYKIELSSDVILSHEQFHFDITELHARKFRKIIEEQKFTENVKKEIRSIYARINKEIQVFQKEYDAATDFSRNFEKQKEWEAYIELELLKYKAYQ